MEEPPSAPKRRASLIRIVTAAVLLAFSGVTGCATSFTLSDAIEEEQTPRYYAGTRLDVLLLLPEYSCGAVGVLANVVAKVGALLDLPLSFVADTITVPAVAYLRSRDSGTATIDQTSLSTNLGQRSGDATRELSLAIDRCCAVSLARRDSR